MYFLFLHFKLCPYFFNNFYTCWFFFSRFFLFLSWACLLSTKNVKHLIPCHLYQTVYAWQIYISYHNICQSLYLRYTNILGVSIISLFTLLHWFPQFILISECEYLSEDHWQNRTSDFKLQMSSRKRPFETPLPLNFLSSLLFLFISLQLYLQRHTIFQSISCSLALQSWSSFKDPHRPLDCFNYSTNSRLPENWTRTNLYGYRLCRNPQTAG